MPETLTESFCERCGTRYTFEAAAPKGKRMGKLKVLSKGFVNFVSNDDRSLDEAFAEARSDEQRELTGQQLDAFHQTFQFCMSCRQYTCANCWNEVESRCLSCAPQFGSEFPSASFPAPLDPLARIGFGHSTSDAHAANGHQNGSAELTAPVDSAWPTADRAQDDQPATLPLPEIAVLPAIADQPAEPSVEAGVEPTSDASAAEAAPDVPGMAAWDAARAAFVDQPDIADSGSGGSDVAGVLATGEDDATARSEDAIDEDVAMAVAAAELARHAAAEAELERQRQAAATAEAEAEHQRQAAAQAEADHARQAAEAEAERQRIAAEATAERERQEAAAAEAEHQRQVAEAEAEAERQRQVAEAEAEAERQRLADEAAAAQTLQSAAEADTESDRRRQALDADAQRERQAAVEAEALRQRLAVEAELERERATAEAERQRQAAESAERQRQAEIAAAATLPPAPIRDDRVETPTWQIVAPETAAAPEPGLLDVPPAVLSPQPALPVRPNATNGAATTNGAAQTNGAPAAIGGAPSPPAGATDWPNPATTPPPQWPMPQATAPQWPVGQGTGRGSNDDLWAASSQDVLSKAGAGVQACTSCGLPLSASARFCRRCGTQQH